jgi:hypothetical protein
MRDRLRTVDSDRVPTEPGKTTTAQYLERWLEHQQHRVRPSTLWRDRIPVESDIVPVAGHVPLVHLGPRHVEAVMDGMRARGLAPSNIVRAEQAAEAMERALGR